MPFSVLAWRKRMRRDDAGRLLQGGERLTAVAVESAESAWPDNGERDMVAGANRLAMVLALAVMICSAAKAQTFGSPGGGFGSAAGGGAAGPAGSAGAAGIGGFGTPRSPGAWQGRATVVPEAGGGFSQYDHRGRSTYYGPEQGTQLRHGDGSTSQVLDLGNGSRAVTGRSGVGFVHPDTTLRLQDRP